MEAVVVCCCTYGGCFCSPCWGACRPVGCPQRVCGKWCGGGAPLLLISRLEKERQGDLGRIDGRVVALLIGRRRRSSSTPSLQQDDERSARDPLVNERIILIINMLLLLLLLQLYDEVMILFDEIVIFYYKRQRPSTQNDDAPIMDQLTTPSLTSASH